MVLCQSPASHTRIWSLLDVDLQTISRILLHSLPKKRMLLHPGLSEHMSMEKNCLAAEVSTIDLFLLFTKVFTDICASKVA